MRPPAFPAVVCCCILATDQWTKWLVEMHLPRGLSHALFPGIVNLVHVQNTGAAFGMFARTGAEARWVLLVLSVLAFGAVTVYFRALAPLDCLSRWALGLIAGGALGNLLDRLFAGAVTDFIDVHWTTHHWPAFNVADSAITTALGLLLLASWRRSRTQGEGDNDT